MNKLKNNKAFTIVELVVVIAVLGILMLLAIPKLLGYTQDAKETQIKNDIKAYEVAIGAELLKNEEFMKNWNPVSKADLESARDKGTLFDKKGKVKSNTEFESEYLMVEENLVKSKLKGEFIVSKEGYVYYDSINSGKDSGNNSEGGDNSEGGSEENPSKTKEIALNSSPEMKQTHTFTIDDLSQVVNISSDTGDVKVISVDGNQVTVEVNNGETTEQKYIDASEVKFTTNFEEEVLRIFENNFDVDTITNPENHKDYQGEYIREYTGADFIYVNKDINNDLKSQDYEYLVWSNESFKWEYPQSGAWARNTIRIISGDYFVNWNAAADKIEKAGYGKDLSSLWENLQENQSFGDLLLDYNKVDNIFTKVSFWNSIKEKKEKIFENQIFEFPSYEYTRENGFTGTPFAEVIPNSPEITEYNPFAKISTKTFDGYADGIVFKGGQSKAQWTYSAKEGYNQTLYKYSLTVEYK